MKAEGSKDVSPLGQRGGDGATFTLYAKVDGTTPVLPVCVCLSW